MPSATNSSLSERLAMVKREELPAVAASFAYFFCLLCGYYVLRPVRDEMGIQAGLGNLPWLFTATLGAMLVAVPVFGWLSSKFPRRTLLPGIYLFFALNLLAFYFLFSRGIAVGDTAKVFFVWVSVFNLFVVSVFWSFMADLFSTQQAKRTYGLIAAGGSVGAICGPALSAILAKPLGVANLLLISAVFLLGAVACIVYLGGWAKGREKREDKRAMAMGGGIWEGVKLVLTSRYLLAICGFVLLYSSLSTFLYFQQQHIVAAAYTDPGKRTALFA
ncbi:MAG: NTP/NDP exchange transporter, partial [Burkholderiales bacterium]